MTEAGAFLPRGETEGLTLVQPGDEMILGDSTSDKEVIKNTEPGCSQRCIVGGQETERVN